MGYSLQDAALTMTAILPDGIGSAYSNAIDLGGGTVIEEFELELSAPVLDGDELGDGDTMQYGIEAADESSFGSPADVLPEVLIQTGADGDGAVAAEVRFRVPSDVPRFIRAKATNSGAGDASGKSVTVTAFF